MSNQTATPLPLERKRPDPLPFPVDALGELEPAVTAIMDLTKAPDAIVSQSLLAAASLAVQPYADVGIDSRRFPVSEYFLTIAKSGDRKSTTDRLALEPHRAFEKTMIAEQGIGFLMEEPTFTGLLTYLKDGYPSIGVFSDEGGRLFGGYSFKQESGKFITGLSSFWDGKQINHARARERFTLVGRRVSLHLMVQPIVAEEALGNRLMTDQGFLSRVLIAYPASNIGTRQLTPNGRLEGRPQAIDDYSHLLAEILNQELPFDEALPSALNPNVLLLSSKAEKLWIKFFNETETEQAEDGRYVEVPEFASKAAEHAARLAAILTLVKDPDAAEITGVIMEKGIRLVNFYLAERLRLAGMGKADEDLALAQKVLNWVQRKEYKTVPLVDIYQRGPTGVRTAAAAAAVASVLEDHGWFIPDGEGKWTVIPANRANGANGKGSR